MIGCAGRKQRRSVSLETLACPERSGRQQRQAADRVLPAAVQRQDLLTVFKAFVDLSDDVSAIPKYIGGQPGGGAGRTASGLAMLMGNACKILQTVAANDRSRCVRGGAAAARRSDVAVRHHRHLDRRGERSFKASMSRSSARPSGSASSSSCSTPPIRSTWVSSESKAVARSCAACRRLSGSMAMRLFRRMTSSIRATGATARRRAASTWTKSRSWNSNWNTVRNGQVASRTYSRLGGRCCQRRHGAPPPGGQPGMGPPPPNRPPGMPPPPAGGMAQAARQAQGNQPSPSNNSPAGNLGNVAGNQPALRPPVPQGGPG